MLSMMDWLQMHIHPPSLHSNKVSQPQTSDISNPKTFIIYILGFSYTLYFRYPLLHTHVPILAIFIQLTAIVILVSQ